MSRQFLQVNVKERQVWHEVGGEVGVRCRAFYLEGKSWSKDIAMVWSGFGSPTSEDGLFP